MATWRQHDLGQKNHLRHHNGTVVADRGKGEVERHDFDPAKLLFFTTLTLYGHVGFALRC